MKWFFKKNKKDKNNPLKNKPKESYDLYNNSETQDLVTQSSVLVAYDEYKNNDSNKKEIVNKEIKGEKAMKTNKKTTNKKQTKSSEGRNIYYVSARKDKDGKKLGWEVKKENAEKITKLCDTKEEAISFVKEKAGNQGSTCVIRKLDGSIQQTLKFDKEK